MMRERVARAALHAFPPAARSIRGQEMVSTLLDASASSRVRFAREIIDLVRSGLRARATQTAEAGARRLVADGLCLAAVWLLTLVLSSDLGNRIRGRLPGYPWDPFSPWTLALLGAALALALIGYDRLAGAAALIFTASVVANPSGFHLTNGDRVPLLVPVICFGALLLAPRQRKPDTRRIAWLVLTAALAVIASTSDDTTAAVLILALIFLVPLALAMLPTDPRLAIACALPATYFGMRIAQDPGGFGSLGLLFLAATPLILAIAITRTRHLQKRTPV
jgi:hypothetical protein